MSAVTSSPADATPARTGLRRYVRDFWAVADQALISGSNFTTMVLVARGLGDPAQFGLFTLVYSALLFSNQLQSALVTQPHNVLGSARHHHHPDEYAAYTTSTLLSQVLLAGIEALAALLAAIIAYRVGWSAAPLLLILAPCVVGWQLMEFVRRVLYTEGRHGAAFLNDCISYGGQMLTIGALWGLDRLSHAPHHWLNGLSAMSALSITASLATLVGLWQIRRSLTPHVNLKAFALNWRFGKWLAGSEILAWCSSVHMYLYLAAVLLGTVATGELKAAQVLFGPTRILAYYLDTVLPIRFARRIAAGAEHTITADVRRLLGRVVLPMGMYCLLIALLARPLLRFTFGEGYAGAYTALILYSVYTFLTYVQMIVATALKARHKTHMIFWGALSGVAVALPTSLVLIRHWQMNGVVIAMIGGALTVTLLYIFYAKGDAIHLPSAVKEEPCPS
jgi:O-antigen/teichoic acid export membrane protein